MDDEKDDFEDAFSNEPVDEGLETPEATEAEEKPPEVTPEEEAEPAPDPEPEAEETPQEPEPEPEPEKSAKEPISREEFKGYTDERDKRQEAEARALSLQTQLDQLNRNAEQAKGLQQRPDMFDDPEGYQSWTDQQRAADALDAKLNMSEMMAVQEFGQEKVDEAKATVNTFAPHERQRILASVHPYREAIQMRANADVLGQISEAGGLDKLIESKLAAQNGATAEISDTITQAAAGKPPPSLAKGGHNQRGTVQETSEEEEFEAVFK